MSAKHNTVTAYFQLGLLASAHCTDAEIWQLIDVGALGNMISKARVAVFFARVGEGSALAVMAAFCGAQNGVVMK